LKGLIAMPAEIMQITLERLSSAGGVMRYRPAISTGCGQGADDGPRMAVKSNTADFPPDAPVGPAVLLFGRVSLDQNLGMQQGFQLAAI
jgi:hypothetical protein